MKKFAQIDNGVVTGHLETSGNHFANLPAGRVMLAVDAFPPLLSTYDEATGTFAPPLPPPDFGATVGPRDFLLLFTQVERKAIRAAAKVDDDVADVMALAEAPQAIRLKHPTTIASLTVLVSKGLLTQARADAITNAQA